MLKARLGQYQNETQTERERERERERGTGMCLVYNLTNNPRQQKQQQTIDCPPPTGERSEIMR